MCSDKCGPVPKGSPDVVCVGRLPIPTGVETAAAGYVQFVMAVRSRVLVVDDVEELRALSRVRLERAGHEIVGEASNGREAIDAATELQPDLVVLDVMMPEMTGLEALPELVRVAPAAKVLVFSSMPDLTLSDVLSLGGHGLLDKIDQFHLVDTVGRLVGSG